MYASHRGCWLVAAALIAVIIACSASHVAAQPIASFVPQPVLPGISLGAPDRPTRVMSGVSSVGPVGTNATSGLRFVVSMTATVSSDIVAVVHHLDSSGAIVSSRVAYSHAGRSNFFSIRYGWTGIIDWAPLAIDFRGPLRAVVISPAGALSVAIDAATGDFVDSTGMAALLGAVYGTLPLDGGERNFVLSTHDAMLNESSYPTQVSILSTEEAPGFSGLQVAGPDNAHLCPQACSSDACYLFNATDGSIVGYTTAVYHSHMIVARGMLPASFRFLRPDGAHVVALDGFRVVVANRVDVVVLELHVGNTTALEANITTVATRTVGNQDAFISALGAINNRTVFVATDNANATGSGSLATLNLGWMAPMLSTLGNVSLDAGAIVTAMQGAGGKLVVTQNATAQESLSVSSVAAYSLVTDVPNSNRGLVVDVKAWDARGLMPTTGPLPQPLFGRLPLSVSANASASNTQDIVAFLVAVGSDTAVMTHLRADTGDAAMAVMYNSSALNCTPIGLPSVVQAGSTTEPDQAHPYTFGILPLQPSDQESSISIIDMTRAPEVSTAQTAVLVSIDFTVLGSVTDDQNGGTYFVAGNQTDVAIGFPTGEVLQVANVSSASLASAQLQLYHDAGMLVVYVSASSTDPALVLAVSLEDRAVVYTKTMATMPGVFIMHPSAPVLVTVLADNQNEATVIRVGQFGVESSALVSNWRPIVTDTRYFPTVIDRRGDEYLLLSQRVVSVLKVNTTGAAAGAITWMLRSNVTIGEDLFSNAAFAPVHDSLRTVSSSDSFSAATAGIALCASSSNLFLIERSSSSQVGAVFPYSCDSPLTSTARGHVYLLTGPHFAMNGYPYSLARIDFANATAAGIALPKGNFSLPPSRQHATVEISDDQQIAVVRVFDDWGSGTFGPGNSGQYIAALDLVKGAGLWSHGRASPIGSVPGVRSPNAGTVPGKSFTRKGAANLVFTLGGATRTSQVVYGLDLFTGAVRWSLAAPLAGRSAPVAFFGSHNEVAMPLVGAQLVTYTTAALQSAGAPTGFRPASDPVFPGQPVDTPAPSTPVPSFTPYVLPPSPPTMAGGTIALIALGSAAGAAVVFGGFALALVLWQRRRRAAAAGQYHEVEGPMTGAHTV